MVLRCVLLLLLGCGSATAQLRSDPVHPIPTTPWSSSGPGQIRTWQLYESASTRGRMFATFVYSGGLHATSGSLTTATFATEAFVPERVSQTAVAMTYSAVANDVCWTVISSQQTAIAGWTRVGSTAYFYQCEGDTTPNQPTLPANSIFLMQVTVTTSAIATVRDLRPRSPFGPMAVASYSDLLTKLSAYTTPSMALLIDTKLTITANLTVNPNVTLRFVGAGQLAVATGVTVTYNGQLEAMCHSGQPIFDLTGTGIILFNRSPLVCPEWWGAYSDNTNGATTVAAINNAAESLQTNGGTIALGTGTYLVQGVDAAGRAIWLRRNNVTLRGQGRLSIVRATNNTDTVICIGANSDCGASSGTDVTGVTIRDLTVQGTGVGAYSALLAGRCILGARVNNLMIHDNWIDGCSMVGIAINAGNGQYTSIRGNHVTNVFYTGINFNGPATQSFISDNIISNVDTVGVGTPQCIQVDGHAIVHGNTCYDSAGYGILHGEGNYDGITIISNNLIKLTVAQGIYAAYHGPVQILGNTIINALTGITLSGDTSVFNIPVNDSLIANNTIINSGPFGIYTSAPRTTVAHNKIIRLTTLTNTGGTALTAIVAQASPYTYGIRLQAAGLFVDGNTVDGASYGVGIWNGMTDAATAFGYNKMLNITVSDFAAINSAGTANANVAIITTLGGRTFEGRSTSPTSGPVFAVNWQINNTSPTVGNPQGWINTRHTVTNTTAGSATTNVQVASTTNISVNDRLMVVNSQGDYTAQYRNVTVVVDPTNLTVDSAITVVSGEAVYADRWTALPNL